MGGEVRSPSTNNERVCYPGGSGSPGRYERVELAGEPDQLVYMGPNLTLRRCTVIVRVPASRLIIRQPRLIDCTVELKQELRNHRGWVSAALKGCRFKGRMLGCDFGPSPGYSTGGEHGQVEDCDFSEARLDVCRFHGCEPHHHVR